jgi:hypothetical protein
MQHPPIVNVDTIAGLIRQQRIARNGTPNKHLVACRICGISIPQGEGRCWCTLPYRYLFPCPKCDNYWRIEVGAVLRGV